MEKLDRSSTITFDDEGATGVAFAIERDFTDLVAIFDRHLANLPAADADLRRHVMAARRAAERGLKLSRKIVSGLQS